MKSQFLWSLVLCLHLAPDGIVGGSAFAQETPARQAGYASHLVTFEVELDGSLTKVVHESRDPSIAVIWRPFVIDARVQKFLEISAEQRVEILKCVQARDGTLAKVEQAVRAQLLPMQMDWLGQVVNRRNCMYDGLVPLLKSKGFFAGDDVTPEELERALSICRARKKEFVATTQRELSLLNAEVRRTLTRQQLELISHSFGKDSRMLEAQGLDFALGQMERACSERQRGLSAVERTLGMAVRLELMPAGRLELAESVSPDQFLNNILKLGQHPEVGLRREQVRRILEVQVDTGRRMSPFSLDVLARLEAGLITEEGAKKEISDFCDREISKALPDLLKSFDEKQIEAMNKLALQRQLMQQGVLGVLLNDEAFALSRAQRQEIVKIVRGKVEGYEDLCIECEMQLWEQIPKALVSKHRPIWEKTFGKEQFKLLPGSPTLLLQGLEKDDKQAAESTR